MASLAQAKDNGKSEMKDMGPPKGAMLLSDNDIDIKDLKGDKEFKEMKDWKHAKLEKDSKFIKLEKDKSKDLKEKNAKMAKGGKDKVIKETEKTNKSSSSSARAKNRKRNQRETWKNYIHKVLKTVHEDDCTLSSKAMGILDSFAHDFFDRISTEAVKLLRLNNKKTLTSLEVQTAARLVLPGELCKHAIHDGAKAVSKYQHTDAMQM